MAMVTASMVAHGCVVVYVQHVGLDEDIRHALFGRAMQELFALPAEAKQRNANNDMQYGGYIGQIPGMAYESMRIKDVTDAGHISDFAGLLWPQGNPSFCTWKAMNVVSLEKTVTKMVLKGHEQYLPAAIEEQKKLIGQHGEPVDYSTLSEMGTLHCCIKEALRMHSASPLLIRQAKKSFTVRTRQGEKYEIPEGHTLASSTVVGNNLPYIYRDPHVYDPYRFSPGREEDRVGGKFSYTSFSGGRHACLGEDFAYMQIKVIWSYLLRNFELTLVSPFPEDEWEKFVPGPRGKVMVGYQRRHLVI